MDRLRSPLRSVGKAIDSFNTALESTESLNSFRKKTKEWRASGPLHYEPLPTTTSIRLIKLAPSRKMHQAEQTGKPLSGTAEDDEDDIHFTMQVAELDRGPRFTALSYTWRQQRSAAGAWLSRAASVLGQSFVDGTLKVEPPNVDEPLAASRKVFCNGQPMDIFENLFAALKEVRRKLPGAWLWIDAVCINQSDTAEIDMQMRIMGRIYQNARLVLVWLGSCPTVAEKGLEILDAMALSNDPLPDYPLYRSELNIGKGAVDDWVQHYAAFTAFHLASRSWHKRVWVVQEVCLARKVIFMHGRHEIKLETLSLSCNWCLNSQGHGESTTWLDIQAILGINLVRHMQFLPATLRARESFAMGYKWTLLQWFQACKGRAASEGKDFVFGGLSLVREDCLSIDQSLQTSVSAFSKTTRLGKDIEHSSNASNTVGSAAEAPTTLTPRGLWSRLAPDSSAVACEVFVNATACLLTHEPVEEVLKMSARLRDKHRYRTRKTTQPLDDKAFSGLPSWVIAIGSWTCGLTADLLPLGTTQPFAACTSRPVVLAGSDRFQGAQTPTSGSSVFGYTKLEAVVTPEVSAIPETTTHYPAARSQTVWPQPLISADGRVLFVGAAVVDHIASVEYETDIPPGFDELRKLMRFLVHAKDIHVAARYEAVKAHWATDGGSETRPCLLEDVACAMVAGHVNGKKVTPSQAGPWLCESIQSRATHALAITERKSRDDQQGLAVIAEVTAELEALKASYSHLRWPQETPVVHLEEDAARAKADRGESWNKRLEELSSKRAAGTNSQSSFRGAAILDRVKMSANDVFDSVNDWSYVWMSPPHERFRRMVSDECSAFEVASTKMLSWRRICLTRRGRVLLGPRWVDNGDSIVLLPGASVPFVLTQEKDDLAREEARVKNWLSLIGKGGADAMMWAFHKAQLNSRLLEIQERLRQVAGQDEQYWLLVGEAYVQGIMQGEADVGLEFGRIGII
ncbi:heterokaryon incompatibility protein-domain-containing protein [Microdochium bolleyi]|uniref:Heterokaryon incompatibility protein-domain-containing protein n=1 Tax=Microdochium bolleyi TaxID=196109 RepID=A0A136ILE5_9PEZI|nr:heterokaryon incompatibility protein-domain-containing protein [Microdochium bolleyi]